MTTSTRIGSAPRRNPSGFESPSVLFSRYGTPPQPTNTKWQKLRLKVRRSKQWITGVHAGWPPHTVSPGCPRKAARQSHPRAFVVDSTQIKGFETARGEAGQRWSPNDRSTLHSTPSTARCVATGTSAGRPYRIASGYAVFLGTIHKQSPAVQNVGGCSCVHFSGQPLDDTAPCRRRQRSTAPERRWHGELNGARIKRTIDRTNVVQNGPVRKQVRLRKRVFLFVGVNVHADAGRSN